MRYRLGKSHQDIIYLQIGDEPDSDNDPRVAVFWEATLASTVVQLLNGADAARPSQLSLERRTDAAPGGGSVSVPPPDRREFKLAELVLDPHHVPNEHGWGRIESFSPVPPVDEILKLVNEYGRTAHALGLDEDSFGITMTEMWREISDKLARLWAAGVAEGRRAEQNDFHQYDPASTATPDGKPWPQWAGTEPIEPPDALCRCGALWFDNDGGCQWLAEKRTEESEGQIHG